MPSDKFMEKIRTALDSTPYPDSGAGAASESSSSSSSSTSGDTGSSSAESTTSTSTSSSSSSSSSESANESTTPPVSNQVADEDEFEFEEERESSGEAAKTSGGQEAGSQGTAGAGATGQVDGVAPAANQILDEDSVDWAKLLPKEVEQTMLKTSRGRAMLKAFKANRELAKPVEEGGLGRIPSTKEIVQYAQDALSFESMEYDFDSGVPEGTDAWINHWFAADKSGKASSGQIASASRLTSVLREVNPEAYSAVSQSVAKDLVRDLLSGAESAGDPEEKKYLARFASAINEFVFGDILDVSKFTGEKVESPVISERERKLQAELEARRKADEETAKRSRETRLRTFQARFAQERDSKLNSFISQALAPVKEILDGTVYFEPTVDKFRSEVLKTVQRSPEWPRFRKLYSDAVTKGTAEAAQAALGFFSQLAMPVVKTLRPRFISDASKLKVQSSVNAQSQAAKGSTSTAVASGAPPAAPGGPGTRPPRNPGEPMKDYLERINRGVAEAL